jgi:uncharacterized protein YbaR (Trm112 family)
VKRDLIDMLACPKCNGDLTLTITNEDQNEIQEGILHCPACKIDYPIEGGIPLLIPPYDSESANLP